MIDYVGLVLDASASLVGAEAEQRQALNHTVTYCSSEHQDIRNCIDSAYSRGWMLRSDYLHLVGALGSGCKALNSRPLHVRLALAALLADLAPNL